MRIYKNVSLKRYNTFGLDYKADCMVHIKSEEEAALILKGELPLEKPFLFLGSGSNILFTDDFKGTILFPRFTGIKTEEQDNEYAIISAGAGESWDKVVEWSVNRGLGGFENLSLIPGLVGATPVQNIGAYGTEVKDSIVQVKTISRSDGSIRVFNNQECEFGYRSSIFKTREKGKYLVTRVYYKLSVNPVLNIKYGSLKEEVNRLGDITLVNVRQAVINIRRSKLPDPEITGNAGSFFKNPVVAFPAAEALRKSYPDLPVYEDFSGGIKLAAGWLIEKCGWKGKRYGDAGVHDKQALVLVNHGKASGGDILELSEQIKESVMSKFGVELDREVEVVGSI